MKGWIFTKKKEVDFFKNNRLAIKIVVLLFFLLFCGAITFIVGRPMMRFMDEPEKFRIWVDSHGLWGKVSFVVMVFLQVVIALIPGEPLEIGAGYAFGAVEGTLLTVIGTLLGSVAVYFMVKKWGIRFCEIFFEREKLLSLRILKDKRKRDVIAFFIFLLPGTPKDLVTYFLGLTEMKLSYVMFLSAVVRLPSIITSTLGGDAIGVEAYITAIVVFAITMLFSLIGLVIYRKILIKKKNK